VISHVFNEIGPKAQTHPETARNTDMIGSDENFIAQFKYFIMIIVG